MKNKKMRKGIENFKMKNKKAFVSTITWMAGTIVIVVMCFFVFLIALSPFSSKIGKPSIGKEERVFPEKADMLYSMLNNEINGIRIDEKIIKGEIGGILSKGEIDSILEKFPIDREIGVYKWLFFKSGKINNINNILFNKRVVYFPLTNKINAYLRIEGKPFISP